MAVPGPHAPAPGLRFDAHHWALILGGSSGFGLATAQKLARHGMNIIVVHRDRRGSMAAIEPEFEKIRALGVGFRAYNLDALAADKRKEVLDDLTGLLGEHGRIRMLMHSVAFGNLKLLAPIAPEADAPMRAARARLAEKLGVTGAALDEALAAVFPGDDGAADALAPLADPPAFDNELLLGEDDFTRTVHAMGTSLAAWAQDVFARKLFATDARVFGMTSEGNEVAWRGYGAVAAAKVALESVARTMAVELAPYGVRTNVVQAGVTDTRALAMIPGNAQLKASARRRNPFGRLTTPADVADVICLLCTDEARWINGTIVRVDGGEHVAG